MSRRVVAAGLLLAMIGAWYWALMPAVPAVSPPTRAGAAAPRAAASVPAVRLERLTAPDVRPAPEHGRNPFRSGTVVGAPGTSAVPAPAATAVPSPSSDVAPTTTWPRIDLIGVAEGREGGALVRTAIVAGPRGVQHARVGDVIEQVYRVDRIAAGGVEVRLLPEARTLRLVLRP